MPSPVPPRAADALVVDPVDPPLLAVDGGGAFPVHRIYCVGRNYAEHAQEMGHSGREPPFFFMKPADAAWSVPAGTTGTFAYPSLTQDLHHEVELVVAIGRGGDAIAAADAPSHIWGYGVGVDLTRRDLQAQMKKQGRPWCIAKGFDRSAPIGPLVPASRVGHPRRGAITLDVDGARRQSGDLGDMIWGVDEVIEQLSRAWTLRPGDLVFTGTPAGVAALERGQRVHAVVQGLPVLDFEVA